MATQDPRQKQGFLPMLTAGQQQATNQWDMSAYNAAPNFQSPPVRVNLPELSSAQLQLQKYNTPINYGGGHPGYGGYGSKDAKGNLINGGGSGNLGQTTPWEWGGEGGKAQTAVSAFSALGGTYLGNEARKLAASDLDFKRSSFEKQYQSQRALVNDGLFDRQQRRERENGLNTEQATAAADKYVKNRGVA